MLLACDRLVAHDREDNVQRTLQTPQGGVPVLPAQCKRLQTWLGVLSVPERLSRCRWVAELRACNVIANTQRHSLQDYTTLKTLGPYL